MSAEAMGWAFRHSPYRGAKFDVHLAIADSVNDQHGNDLWITQGRLAEKARVSRDAANKAMKALVADGFLELLEDNSARGRANRYRFLFVEDAGVVYESRAVPKVAEGVVGDDTPQDDAPEGGVDVDDTPVAGDDKVPDEGVQSETTGVQSTTTPGVVTDDTEPKRTQSKPKGQSGTTSPPAAVDGGDRFDEFHAAYPRHRTNGRPLGGGSPKRTRAVWARLSAAKRQAALDALENYRQDLLLTGQPVQHATTWLNGAEWETYAAPPSHDLDPIAVALAEACGHDPAQMTGQARTDVAVAAAAIAAAGGTPDGVAHVVGQWRKTWPEIAPSEKAVARNWHRFAGAIRNRSSGSLCTDCGQERATHDQQLCAILKGSS